MLKTNFTRKLAYHVRILKLHKIKDAKKVILAILSVSSFRACMGFFLYTVVGRQFIEQKKT